MQILDSFVQGGLMLPEEDRRSYFDAVVTFMATGELPESLTGMAEAMVTAIMPALENSRMRAINGSRGGRPKRTAPKGDERPKPSDEDEPKADEKAEQKANPKADRKANEKADPKANRKANEGDGEKPTAKLSGKRIGIGRGIGINTLSPSFAGARASPGFPEDFEPPSVEEVRGYAEANMLDHVNARAFVDYYEAQGWLLPSGLPLTDWRAKLRQWDANDKVNATAKGGKADDGVDWSAYD